MACFGILGLSIISRRLIQFCLYLSLTSCIPEISSFNNNNNNIFLIDISVPSTHNLNKTMTDKQSKYQELANEICVMWKQKAAHVILIVISSTGVIPKSLSQSLTILK